MERFFIAYDNMRQLNRLKTAKSLLPLPSPYDQMWQQVSKIIDGLHLANHRNPACKEMYNPDDFIKRFGSQTARNTQAAEQTFSWVTKFAKQANSMPKERQMFFLHRVITLRNR